ncbi:hypothetical protein [Spirosoma spitsbergense]|uniref:hypothetical protein n=1 Tax=Spirosoma spitsbergense TaxID=431554 RepID=UPI000370BBA7|nr:hypothetical protein [Spirosoma spitsbergense]
MSQTIHPIAKEQVRRFVELMFDELPASWTDRSEVSDFHAFEMQLWLACFDVKVKSQKPHRFALLTACRKRAENYYQDRFRQVHHTPQTWAFFRFRLELALLVTAGADHTTLLHCYEYHDITAGFAHRIDYEGRERPATTIPF